jgi:hypothetical protein
MTNGAAYQAVELRPNTRYILSYWANEEAEGNQLTCLSTSTSIAGAIEGLYADEYDITEGSWKRYWRAYDSGSLTAAYVVIDGLNTTNAWFDAIKVEPSDRPTPWRPSTVSGAVVLDAGGIKIDGSEGGTLRLKTSSGNQIELTSSGLNSGTAFPSSPVTNDRYFRTDLGMEFFYNGTRWLSTQLFNVPLAGSKDAAASAGASNILWVAQGMHGGSDLWIEDVHFVWRVLSGGTALSSSHKWAITVDKAVSSSTTLTNVATRTIDSLGGGSYDYQYLTTVAVDALYGSSIGWRIGLTKTGTPGALYWGTSVTYRVVAT